MISLKSIASAIRVRLLYQQFKRSNIILGKKVIFIKKPLVNIHEKAKLIIGDNVTINSQNKGYHINMFMPCKLMADKPNAVIEIGSNTRLHGSCLHAYTKIKIGNNCLIAANCQIFDGNGHDLSFPNVANRIHSSGDSKEIIIDDDVWLGTGVIVLPGVKIGKGSVISANSVVHKDVPPMVVAGGNPLKIIKSF